MGREPSRSRRGAAESEHRLCHRLWTHPAFARWRRDLEGGLHAPRAEGRLDHQRARRDHVLRRSLRPSTSRSVCSSAIRTSACSSSDDGGKTWTSSIQGVPKPWTNTTYWVVFDPRRARPHVGRDERHARPAAAEDVAARFAIAIPGRRGPQRRRRQDLDSADGPACPKPPPPTCFSMRAASPTPASSTWPASERASSGPADGGKSWEMRNNGLPAHEPFAWKLAQDRDGVLYLVVARRSEDGSIGNDRDGALYRSQERRHDLGKGAAARGRQRTHEPGRRFAGCETPIPVRVAAQHRRPRTAGGGIYLSTDAGASWKPVLTRDQHVHEVTIDPRNPSGVRLRLRVVGMAIRRPRRALEANARVQLQVGPPRDPGSL